MEPEIVLGVTGSIAAYKAAELVRLMRKASWNVTVIMTEAAVRFVAPLTFQTLTGRPVATTLFPDAAPQGVIHISLAERAGVLVIAPCSAATLARLAGGLADDLLTCTALATRAPVVVAPAMNAGMWAHPATQANVARLRRFGVTVMDTAAGELACGTEGKGRMPEPAVIFEQVGATLAGQAGKAAP